MKYLLIFCLFCLPALLPAQDSMALKTDAPLPYTLTIAALELLNPYQQSLSLHGEFPLARRWALDVGLGAVLGSLNLARFKGESMRGWKVHPTLKYYVRTTGRIQFYTSLSFKYIDVYNERFVNTSRQGGQYTEWLLRRKHRVTIGGAFRYGFQYYGGKQKRVVLDYFFGLGIRNLRVTNGPFPADVDFVDDDNFFSLDRAPGNYLLVGPIIGLNLGWVIGKGK